MSAISSARLSLRRIRIKPLLILLTVLWVWAARLPYMPNLTSPASIRHDNSWQLAMSALWDQGELLGREVTFTYGVLGQALFALGTHLNVTGLPHNGFPLAHAVLIAASLVHLALALLLWRRLSALWSVVVIFGMVVICGIDYSHLRPTLLILYAVLLARALESPIPRGRLRWAALAGLCAVYGQLISTDTVIYMLGGGFLLSLIGLVLRLLWLRGSTTIQTNLPSNGEFARLSLIILGIVIIGNIAISLFFTLSSSAYPSFFHYQSQTLAIAASYAIAQVFPWSYPPLATLVLGGAVAASLFFTLFILQSGHLPARERLSYLPLVVVGLVSLRSAVTRSDLWHIALAILPLVGSFLIIGDCLIAQGYMAENRTQGVRTRRVRIGLWMVIFIGLIGSSPLPKGDLLRGLWTAISNPFQVRDTFEAYRTQAIPPETILPQGIIDYVGTGLFFAFPQDSYLPILREAAGARVFLPIGDLYNAHTITLQTPYSQWLTERDITPIYAPGKGIDDVQEVTRLPRVWDALYQQFMIAASLNDGHYLLKRRTAPPTDEQRIPLPFQSSTRDRKLIVRLNAPATCSLIALTMQVDYPLTRFVGRPNPFQVSILANGFLLETTNLVALEVGASFQTYIRLMDTPETMIRLLGTEAVPAVTWDELVIRELPTGLLGVSPSALLVSGVTCLTYERPGMAEAALTTPTLTPDDSSFDLTRSEAWNGFRIAREEGAWFGVTGRDPSLFYRPPLDLCAAEYSHVAMALRVPPGEGTSAAEVFFALDGDMTAMETAYLTLPLLADGEVHRYAAPLAALNLPPSTHITGIRYDPILGAEDASHRLELIDFRLIRAQQPENCPPPQPDTPREESFSLRAWQAVNAMVATETLGSWRVLGDDPQLIYEQPLSLCVGDYAGLGVRLATTPDAVDPFMQLFFQMDGKGEFNEPQSLRIGGISDGTVHEYIFLFDDLRERYGDEARITRLRFDPIAAGAEAGTTKVQIERLWLVGYGEPSCR
ncbi:MAG TPA: hypothetical protein PLD47_14630 [Aggregatilineales bacterium]|nr:hypothetical protein [Aggregatilineales bacterium]